MCDLCTRNKKVFTHEHELFTKEELRRHEDKGDDKPGAADQSGFRGHPKCGFCRQHFYGDDELYTHCREKHERCHICDRRNQGRSPQYYLNYNALEEHFRKDHFVCLDRECLEKKFVVFDSEMDLKAHQLEAHPNGLTKDALRDARRVDLSDFSYRERYQPDRGRRDGPGRGRGGSERGRGRGRDPNSEPIPASSAQPIRRDELAYQRQMAVQTAQSVSGRTFGGQLSSVAPSSTPSNTSQTSMAPRTAVAASSNNFPSLSEVGGSLPQVPAPPTKEEEARQRRHQAVIERAANMLRNDDAKLGEFRDKISSFKNGSTAGPELIECFFSLFDSTSTELGKLVKELADIFEISSKRDDLLKAWNDWRAINEDYPSLPGSSSSSQALTAGSHGGSRVLKLKSSTAQSSRSSVNRTASWGTTPATGLFPSLGKRPVGPSSSKNSAPSSRTPWAGGSSASSPYNSQPASRSSSQRPSRVGGSPQVADSAAFPALPAAAKPTSTVFTPGYMGNGVRRVNVNGTAAGASSDVNAWTGRGEGSGQGSPDASGDADDAPIGGRQKGRKQKRILINYM